MKKIRSNDVGVPHARHLLGACTSAITALTVAMPAAHAQQPGSGLEEIVVTATRRSQSVQDVPYNIQAISSQTLTEIGALEQRDFARMIPGLSMVDSGARQGVTFVLRGLTTGADVSALGQTTTTYVDDTQVDLYFGLLDLKLLDIDRIEVLRGPQGTLYGGGAIGGTIRYISTKPDLTKTDAQVRTGVSTTEGGGTNQEVSGMLNLPLIDDKLALRANVGYFDNDGFIDNIRLGQKDINWERTLSGRVALLVRPIDPLQVELTHYYQRGRYGAAAEEFEMLGHRRVDYYAPGGEGDRRAGLTNMSVKFDFGASELTSSSSYVRERGRNFDDNTFFLRDGVFARFVPEEDLPEMALSTDRRREARIFSQELRLVSKDTERWDWLAGAYWYDSKTREALQERVDVPFAGQAEFEDYIGASLTDGKEYFLTSDPTKINQWAVFGEIGVRPIPELRVSVGARHFDYRLRETFYSIDQFFARDARNADGVARTTPFADEYSSGRADDDGQVFRFNASYDVTPDDLVYMTIAQGYRPGGYNVVTPNSGVPLDQRAYDPDSIVSYEVGGKLSLLGQRVYLSTAAFYIDWSDIQTQVPTDSGYNYQGNAGKAAAHGFEVELQSRGLIADDLSLGIGYAYTDVKLEESIVGLGLEGDHVPRVPQHAGSFMADYSFEGSGTWTAGINLTTSYTGTSFSALGPRIPRLNGTKEPNPNYLKQDAYWLTNLSARFNSSSWGLRLFVDNVFNESVDLYRSFESSDSRYRSPFVSRGVNQPRTIGLQLTWDLD